MNNPCQIPLSFYAGETVLPPPILWVDQNGNPINLTGYTATLSGRQTVNSADPPIILATTGNGQLIINATTGSIQINIPASVTALLPNYFQGVWDLWVYSGAGVATRLLGGLLFINEPVTRA